MSYPSRGGTSYSRGGSKAGQGHTQASNPNAYDFGFYGSYNPMMMMAGPQSQTINGAFPVNRQTFAMPVPGYNSEGHAAYKTYVDRIREELRINNRFKQVEEYFRYQNEYSLEGEPKKDLEFLDEIKRPKYDYETWVHFEKFKKESDESIDPSKLILKLCQVVLKMGHQYVPHDQGNRRLRVVQFILKDKNVLEFTFVCANNKKANKATAIEALKMIFPEIYDIILYTTFDQVGEDAILQMLDEQNKLKEEIENADNDIYRKCFKGCKFVGEVKVEDSTRRIGNKDPEASENDPSFKERCTSRMFSTISNNLLQKNAGRSLNFETKILRKVQPEKSLEGEGGNEYEIVATDNHGKKYFRAQLICQNKTDAKQISGLKFIELFAQKVYFLIYRIIMERRAMEELMQQTTEEDSQEQGKYNQHEQAEPDHGSHPLFSYEDESESQAPADQTSNVQSDAMINILRNLENDEKEDGEDQADSHSVTSSEHEVESETLHNKDLTDANKSTCLQNDESEAASQFSAFSVMAEYLKKMFGLEIVEYRGRLPSDLLLGNLKDLPSETVLSQNLLETLNLYLRRYGFKLLAVPQKHVDFRHEAAPKNIKSFSIRFILEKEDKMAVYPTVEGLWDYEVRASNAHYIACLNFGMVHLIWKLFPALGLHLAFNSIRSWLGLSDTTRSLQLGFPVASVLTPQTPSKTSVSNSFNTDSGSAQTRGLIVRPQEQFRQTYSDQPKSRLNILGALNFREGTPIPSPGLTGSQTPFSGQSNHRFAPPPRLVTELGIRKACEAVESFADKKVLIVSNQNLVEEIKRFERLHGNLDSYFEYKLQEFEISGIFFHDNLNHICSSTESNYDDKIKKKEQFLSHIYSNVKGGDFASALNSVIHSIFKDSLDIKTDGPYITFELNGQLLAVMNAKVQNKKIAKKVISIVLLRKLWPELYFDHVIKQCS